MVASLSAGCAFTTARLDVAHEAQALRRGPLSSVEPVELSVAEFTDGRSDRARIGYKKNLYGMNTADILTTKPVTDIVRDSVQAVLSANGHRVGGGGRVRVEGEVSQFWFDTQVGFWTVEFMGTIDCKLAFHEASSGELVYTGRYSGHYNEESMGGLEGSWERVMNAALSRMVEAIASDEALAAALQSLPGVPAPGG